MSWYNECLFGSTPEARKASLAKLPSEVLGLLQERGLSNITLEADVETARGIALPEELMEMVREHLGAEESALPMSLEEAKEHRAKLMQERGAFVKTAEKGWQQHSYSFCEH
jgi:citrate lyase beta subunit